MELDQVLEAVRAGGTRIVDSHVHPLDVMGLVHPADFVRGEDGDFLLGGAPSPLPVDFRRPALGQRLGMGRVAHLITDLTLRALPAAARSALEGTFRVVGERRLAQELEAAGVDEMVLVPVEPWSSAQRVRELCGPRCPLLGSIDLHALDEDAIERELKRQMDELGIVGVKLHPNLQGFWPWPRDNPPPLAARLRRLYALISEHGLYLLVHGGRTSLPARVHPRYRSSPRAADHALLEHLFDGNGKGELVELCSSPIVVAHLGAAGLPRLDEDLMGQVLGRNDRVYFDTSAMPARLIARHLDLFGCERLLFGSDGLYFRIHAAVEMLHAAVRGSRLRHREVEVMARVLGGSFAEVAGRRPRVDGATPG